MADRGAWYPLTNQGVQWDPQGRPYYHTSDGRRAYIPPISAAQYRDDPRMLAWARSQGATTAESPEGITAGTSVPGGNFLRGRGQWNTEEGRYDRPINWGNIASAGIGAAIGAPLIAPLFGSGAAAAGAPSAGAGAGGATTIVAPGIPAVAGTGAGLTAPAAAGVAGAAGAAAPLGSLAAATPSIIDRIRDAVLSPNGIASLASLIPALMLRGGPSDAEQQRMANADRLQKITEARMRRADPLHQAAVQLAFGRLPVSARQGITVTPVPLPPE